MRHATAKAMPAVFRMEKMIVRERCTDTTCSKGTPSYGITPPGSQQDEIVAVTNFSCGWWTIVTAKHETVEVFLPALITHLAMSSPPPQVGR